MISFDFMMNMMDTNTSVLDQPRDRNVKRDDERKTVGKKKMRKKRKKGTEILPHKKLPSHYMKGADLTGIAPPIGCPEGGEANIPAHL